MPPLNVVFVNERQFLVFGELMEEIISSGVGSKEGVVKIVFHGLLQGGSQVSDILERVCRAGSLRCQDSFLSLILKDCDESECYLRAFQDALVHIADCVSGEDSQLFVGAFRDLECLLSEGNKARKLRGSTALFYSRWKMERRLFANGVSVSPFLRISEHLNLYHLSLKGKNGTDEGACLGTPQVFGGTFVSPLYFSWNIEKASLFSISFLHFGPPCLWFFVEPKQYHLFSKLVPSFPMRFDLLNSWSVLENLRYVQSLKEFLMGKGVSVSVVIQCQGESIVSFPFTPHCVYKTGFSVLETVHFMFPVSAKC